MHKKGMSWGPLRLENYGYQLFMKTSLVHLQISCITKITLLLMHREVSSHSLNVFDYPQEQKSTILSLEPSSSVS